MANRTVKDAKSIKGTNPQYLVEKIIRSRIYDSKYWKEECFALTAELLVDKAMELRFIGGVHGGNVKPSPFLCLTLKMLQIQPEKDIIVEFIKNEDFKYVRCLGAFYMRLTGTSQDCYNYLEPLLNDNRKIRRQNREGAFELVYVDEFVDELLKEERLCDIILPRIQKRHVLEETNELVPRVSILEADDDDDEDDFEPEPVKPPEKNDKSHRHTSKKHSGRSGEKRRNRSISNGSAERKKVLKRWSSGDRDRKADKPSSSHKDKGRDKDYRAGRDRRSSKDYDRDRRPSSHHGRDRGRERDRPRDMRDRERSRSRERDRNHRRTRR